MAEQSPNKPDDRVVDIRAAAAARQAREQEQNSPIKDLRKYEQSGVHDDYRERMIVNIVAVGFLVALIGAGIWIADTMASMRKNQDEAIQWMKKATALEEQMSPPSGPPSLIKPTHEMFGEILLRAGKPAEAAEQFKIALLRQPNRARSLLGAARAAAQSGNQAAASAAYTAFLEQWKKADEGLAELREARDYLKR